MKHNTEQFGKYTLLEKLASGGMAEVFLARAPGAGGIRKFIAIKRILPQFSDNPEYKEMFTSEAKIAVNLSHGNVVSIYEFGIENKQLYLVMDYVEGRNLRQILNKMKESSKRFSIDQIVYMIKEIAAGLDHANRCLDGSTGEPLNIIHRDMSPQNIMISFEGEVKIVDFGIAKAGTQNETTADGTLKGKFGYMSPEQAEGQAIDLRTDIFSLGIILWELIANERLFLSNNEINTLRKIRKCHIPSLTRINPNIPPALERIIRKTLAKDKNFRYQHSAALHRDLSRFLNNRYPDFSPHDFSDFIKKIYTDEILEDRKRLVEYAKTSIGDENNFEDKTVVVSPTNDPPNDPPLLESLIMGETYETTSGVTLTDSNEEPLGLSTQTSSQTDVPREKIFDFSQDLVPGSSEKESLSSSQVDEPHSQIVGINTVTNTNKSLSLKTGLDVNIRKENIGHPIAILLTVSALVALTYATNMHKKILPTTTLKIISHLEGQIDRTSNNTPKPNDQNTPYNQLVPGHTKSSKGQIKPLSEIKVENLPISISSTPSGANIFINGTNTGKSTPSRVLVPSNKSIKMELKKENYITYTKHINVTKAGKVFQSRLQRAAVGYLDIDVRPPSPAVKIYLDGKLLMGEQLPISKYAAPAKKLTIEAKNPLTNTYAKQRIILQQGQRRSIIFKLKRQFKSKRSKRTPSHQKQEI